MNTLLVVLDFLVAHGPSVLLGSTLLLLFGCLIVRQTKHPVDRRRLGVLTATATGLYLAAALLPLPRWTPIPTAPAPTPAAFSAAPQGELPPPADPAARLTALRASLDQLLAEAPAASPSVAAAPMRHATAATWTWGRILAGLYVVIAACMLLSGTAGWWRLRQVLRRSARAPRELITTTALPPGTRVLVADRSVRPFCTGWLRPVIVLPPELLRADHRPRARAVLRHEVAHLHSGDPCVQVLLALLAIPLAMHPLFWWLVRDVRFQSEVLADDAAAGNTDRAAYARELIELAETSAAELGVIGTVPVFHRPSEFYRRMHMLLQREGSLSRSTSRARRATQTMAAFACTAIAAGLCGVPAAAQQPANNASPEQRKIDSLQDDNARLRDQLADLRAELERLQASLKQQADSHIIDTVKTEFDSSPGNPDRLPAPTATPKPAPNATGTATPTPRAVFLPGANGLPSQAMTQPTPQPAASITSMEAIADLASRCLDLQGEIEIAEVTATETKQLAEAGRASMGDSLRANSHLSTLKKKLMVVKKLIEGEIQASESELRWLYKQQSQADSTERLRIDAQVQRATMRLEALRAVR